MPHPFLIVNQSDYLIQIVDINTYTEEANWSGSSPYMPYLTLWDKISQNFGPSGLRFP